MKSSLSVIVPCRNEEKYITFCINALLKQKEKTRAPFEIIVVDNGSSDNSLAILEEYGENIALFSLPGKNISSVRNYGAQNASGIWLAFIDGDVEVDEQWLQSVWSTLKRLKQDKTDNSLVITGSTVTIPDNATWIEKVWFKQLSARDRENTKYINSGNLIISSYLFNKIGGFDGSLTTGEDLKLCQDATLYGSKIIKDNSIAAIHHGYPKTIKQFFMRERWHGKGMVHYLYRPWEGRDLLLSIYYIFLSLLLFPIILYAFTNVIFLMLFFMLYLLPIFPLAVRRSNYDIKFIPHLILLYFIYGWARAFSIFDILKEKINRNCNNL